MKPTIKVSLVFYFSKIIFVFDTPYLIVVNNIYKADDPYLSERSLFHNQHK